MAIPVVTDLAEIQEDTLGNRLIHCVGYAPSQRRRCNNPVNAKNRGIGTDHIYHISRVSDKPDEVQKTLEKAAKALLCQSRHQNQSQTVARAWYAELQSKEQRPIKDHKAERPLTTRTQQQRTAESPDSKYESTASAIAFQRDDSDAEKVTVSVKAQSPIRVVTTVERISHQVDRDARPTSRQSNSRQTLSRPKMKEEVQDPTSKSPSADDFAAINKDIAKYTLMSQATMAHNEARVERLERLERLERKEAERSRDAIHAAREARIAQMMSNLEAREERLRKEEEQRSRNAVDAAREARLAQLTSSLEATIAQNERLQKDAEERRRAADAAALDARLARLESSISTPKTCRKSSSRPVKDQHVTPDAIALDRRLSQFESLMTAIMTTHEAKIAKSSPTVSRSEESMLHAFTREQFDLGTAFKASIPSKKSTKRSSLSISTDPGFDATGIYTPRSTGFSDFTATGIRTPPGTDYSNSRSVNLSSPSSTNYSRFKTAGICTPLSTEYAGSAASNMSTSTGTEDSYFTATELHTPSRRTPHFDAAHVEIPLSTTCDESVPTGMLTPMSISYSDLTSAEVCTPSSTTTTDCHNVEETVRQSEELLREFAASMTKVLKVVSRNQKVSKI